MLIIINHCTMKYRYKLYKSKMITNYNLTTSVIEIAE